MPSIFTLAPLEDGGPIARGGFDYQDHVAAAFCLEMLHDASIHAVWCETHDDILLDRLLNEQHIVEFIQVKSDNLDQHWSLAKLCERKNSQSGSSIIEKQLARDRGDEQSFFRLVTLRAVNNELEILKQSATQRSEEGLARLIVAINERISDFTSPKQHGTDYWTRQMRWDVRESILAIENSNIVALDKYLTETLNLPLLHRHKRALYTALLDDLRRLGAARWTEGPQHKRITREEFIRSMAQRASMFPAVVGNVAQQELHHLERESTARCLDRWLALKVPEDIASHLANDADVGAPSPQLLASIDRSFVWLIGDFGSGKSLTAERIYQNQLLAFRESASARIPVFVEGLRVAGRNLRDEAETLARRLGDIAVRGVLLVLDGIDQAGSEGAIDLLRQASVLSRTWQNASVIVTSTPLPCSAYEEAQARLPLLSELAAIDLMQRIVGAYVPAIHSLPQVLRADITKPLFSVLIATRLKENQHLPDSIGELLANVAHKAIQPLIRDYTNTHELLVHLAVRSTDRGGGPVPICELSTSILQLHPLFGTRLVTEANGCVAFTVTILQHWFAAQALSTHIVTAADLVRDTIRRERWRYPLAIAVGTKSFAEVEDLFGPLVRAHPAFSSLVIRDGLHEWPAQQGTAMVAPADQARQIRHCVLAWSDALQGLAAFVTPTTTNGQLRKMLVCAGQGYVSIFWRDHETAPEIEVAEAEMSDDLGQYEVWINAVTDQPACAWKQTQRHIASSLAALMATREIPVELLLREAFWNEACERTVRSAIRDLRIPTFELQTSRPRPFATEYAKFSFATGIEGLLRAGAQFLEAPYPQVDLQPTGSWISEYFSAQRSLERTRAVYSAALQAYEALVGNYLPKFAPRLRHYAVLPVRLHGILIPDAEHDGSGREPFSCRFEPLRHGARNEIAFELGSEQQARETVQLNEGRIGQARALRPECADWLGAFSDGGSLSTIYQRDPCSRIVYEWLESDLQEVNWWR